MKKSHYIKTQKSNFLPKKEKPVNKRQTQVSHKIVVLASLMIEAIDELIETDIKLVNMPEHPLNGTLTLCEELLTKSNQFKEVSSTTYLNTMSNAVDSAIRKNFKVLDEEFYQQNKDI